jgi:pyridoxine 5-phosphate synthase
MARLGVNIDHVATLRQARGGREPEPLQAALLAELGGADGIVFHLREDRRHIRDRDLYHLREIIQTKLDLEMAATDEMAKIALEVKPDLVTLVPERRAELTTEGGLDVAAQREGLKEVVSLLHEGGIIVSLFIDPNMDQVKASHKINADYIEIHTGAYANATRLREQNHELEQIVQTAKMAAKLGLGVNAGHGLNYRNIKRLIAVQEIVEFNIGHSIISRALLVGVEQSVREMKAILSESRHKMEA